MTKAASHKPRRSQDRHAPEPNTLPLLATTLDVLGRVLEFERPADAVLSYTFRNDPQLGSHDRAFIAEAVYGVLRRLRGLQTIAAPATPRRLLLAWLARHGGINMRQFTGAVKDDELDWLKEMKAADLSTQSEAVRLELPDWLHERLHARFGDHLPVLAEALNRPAPLDLRVNTVKMARDDVLNMFTTEGIAVAATPYSPLGLRLQGKPALQKHPMFIEGGVEVQDEGSQLLGLLLAPKRGEMVCDFCAGAGGKTLILGALMANTGRLYAYDVSEKRLSNMKPRLARSGLSNVHPQLIAHERDPKIKRLVGKFDRVLVDAPCSGLGTLRRNPDLKWRQSPESLAELTVKQAAILESAARLLKHGGRLVYATCSLLEEENEAIVQAFLTAHPDYHLVPVGEVLAAQNIALEMGDYLRLDPAIHNTDGFFAAVLERAA
ncbi:MAG: RsmB/NOP family class I SAM-dependent RNA methyltransferase [Pseudomonadota bacterium]|nr:RsmB/NOP family class I SAM-dependent RNA methyltransferase [Pseudomonadota bacterium]MDP1905258.1 RsmB/NOP family class I SAM-dependent RNA methyltransferase [Pseudomonadota bacterium]MDP2352544.1 RsmB/NOP family class I SAM-dependent RNA methyltransferase [Pseudomonadota bacterium]